MTRSTSTLTLALLLLTACQPSPPQETAAGTSSSSSARSLAPVSAEYSPDSGEYVVTIPSGWYAHELEGSVIFTPSETFTLPQGTEGYAIGQQFSVRIATPAEITGANDFEGWMTGNRMVPGNEFFVERTTVTNGNGLRMARVIMKAAQADGRTLTYVYQLTPERFLVISHYPYVEGSDESAAFERFAESVRVPATAGSPAPGNAGARQVGPAFMAAINALAESLNVDASAVSYVRSEPREWSDGCLGLGGPAESCIAMITPGYLVTVSHDGTEYRFRTNEDGTAVRKEQ